MRQRVFKEVQVFPVKITSVIQVKNKIVRIIKVLIYQRWPLIWKKEFRKQLANYHHWPVVLCQAFRY